MTQHYVGTKIVQAWEADKDGVPGYGVKYADGYTSWSPQEAFEEAYLPLGVLDSAPPHVARMVAEEAVLTDRLKKLSRFVDSERFSGLEEVDQELLRKQHGAMRLYAKILNARVERAQSAA